MKTGDMIRINRKTMKVEIENYLSMIDGFKKENRLIRTSIFTSKANSTIMKNELMDYPQLITLKKTTPLRYETNERIVNQFMLKYETVFFDEYFESYNRFREFFFDKISSFKNIAFIDGIYSLENDFDKQKKLWTDLCSNDLFDQWAWCAPFGSYLLEKSNTQAQEIFKRLAKGGSIGEDERHIIMHEFSNVPLILLLRVYEVGKVFDADSMLFTYYNMPNQSLRYDEIRDKSDCIVGLGNPVISEEDFLVIKKKLENSIIQSGMRLMEKHPTYNHCLVR